jgi:acyl-CoA synthetase (AMP-forming)/AMP-acid ligase II
MEVLMFMFADIGRATTPALLADVAQVAPQKPFIIADDGELTYASAAATCAALAAGMTRFGLRPDDRVGILLPNGIRWCAALIGAHAAGLCAVPLNTWYRREELAAVARRARLRAVITQSTIFGFDAAAAVGDVDVVDYLGALEWPRDEPLPPALTGQHLSADPVAALRNAPTGESDDALLLFTSGSTAAPKAVRLRHGAMLRNAHAIGERQGIRPDDRFWFASPLFFVFGCANALPNVLTHAATLCVQERFDPASALEFIERLRCTVYYGVAPVTRALAACEDLRKRDVSSLRTGSANATPEDLRIAIEVLGVDQVCNAYGMTEGYGHSAMTACTDPADVRINSQGTPLPTQELRIVAGDAVAQVGVAGDIQIRGTITPGYLDTPATFDPNGWLATGDTGLLDAEGRLHYLGRKDEMMKVKGVNISPLEIETLLVQHDSVDEAFVFGLPNGDGDQRVGCVLVPPASNGDHAQLGHDVRDWMRARASSYKLPQTILVVTVDQLPLTATGKVNKKVLKEQTQASLEHPRSS